jgi:hypothetical protein
MKALLDIEEEEVKAAAKAKVGKKKRKSDQKDPKAKRKSFCETFEEVTGDKEAVEDMTDEVHGEEAKKDSMNDRDQRANRRKFQESFSSDINSNNVVDSLEEVEDMEEEEETAEVEEEKGQTDADECFKFSKQQRTIGRHQHPLLLIL